MDDAGNTYCMVADRIHLQRHIIADYHYLRREGRNYCRFGFQNVEGIRESYCKQLLHHDCQTSQSRA